MAINPVQLSTHYQYLDQYAMGGKVIAKKELPWKLIFIGVTALVVTFYFLNDLKPDKTETSNHVLVNSNLEE